MDWIARKTIEPVVAWSYKFPWLKDWMFNALVIVLLTVCVTLLTLIEMVLLEVLQ